MTAGKVSNYDSEQDHHTERGSRLYGIFFKERFFFLDIFRNGKKNVSLFCYKLRKFIFLFPCGYSCNTRFFYTWKERLPGFGKPRRLGKRLLIVYSYKCSTIFCMCKYMVLFSVFF